MTLKVDFSQFSDEKGRVIDLTEQAKTVFTFLSKIVSSVSLNIKQTIVNVDLSCSSRAEGLSCEGYIEAKHTETGVIEWHCDTCKAAGEISHWQGSISDHQKRTIH